MSFELFSSILTNLRARFRRHSFLFFFNDTPTTEIYTLSLHDALPIYRARARGRGPAGLAERRDARGSLGRSEEHTSELQSRFDLVCRLLLEKKNTIFSHDHYLSLQHLQSFEILCQRCACSTVSLFVIY